MPKNEIYKWLELQMRLQAAATLLAQQGLDDDQDGKSLRLEAVTARVGTFVEAPTRSANDLAAKLLLILLLIWWWNCAKYRANFVNPQAFLRKLTRGEILEPVPAEAAWNQAFEAVTARLSLCHFDHLPILFCCTPRILLRHRYTYD